MEDPEGREVRARYRERLVADLAGNDRAQCETSAAIEERTGELLRLRHDHAVLTDMKQALDAGLAPPPVRRGKNEPSLVSLVRQTLGRAPEPLSAAEVTAALHEAAPGRAFKATVVRTTLDALAARGDAQRLKNGHAVRFTKP